MIINKKIILLSSFCVSLAACAGTSGPRYVPRPYLPLTQYTDENHHEDYMDKKYYAAYVQREPCQHYRSPPRNTILDHCFLRPAPEEIVVVEAPPVQVTHTEKVVETRLLPIVSTYAIYFDFDKSNIRASEEGTLQRVADEIRQYNPEQITVTGHTDSSGSAEYNQILSGKRADSVVYALEKRGIRSEVLDEEARGESALAVQTGDGVKLQDNRRVVIDFRR
jgi:outer membrane protein OmpA-like peptidoglycan-associated protein